MAAEAIHLPSGETASDTPEPVWPLSVCRETPSSVFQIRTVLSVDPDMSNCFSGEKSTEQTASHGRISEPGWYRVMKNVLDQTHPRADYKC